MAVKRFDLTKLVGKTIEKVELECRGVSVLVRYTFTDRTVIKVSPDHTFDNRDMFVDESGLPIAD